MKDHLSNGEGIEIVQQALSVVLARTKNGVLITDPDVHILWVNEGFTRMSGYTLDDVRGKHPKDFLFGRMTDRSAIERISEAIAQGRGFKERLINYDKNGKPYWVEVDLQPLHSDSGKLIGFLAIDTDITEQEILQQELEKKSLKSRQAERFLRSTLDALDSHVAITKSSGEIVFVNRAWKDFAIANGADLASVCEGANYLAACDHFGAGETAEDVGALIRSGANAQLSSRPMLYECSNGAESQWFQVTVRHFEQDGDTYQVITHKNVTPLLKAQIDAAKQNELLQEIVNLLPYAVFWKDCVGRYLGANSVFAEIVGTSDVSELIGHSDDDLSWHPGNAWTTLTNQMCASPIASQEISILNANGNEIWIEISTALLTANHGEVIGHLGVFQDVTLKRESDLELRKARAAAEAASRAKSEFLANMSHEIRTPMNGVFGMTELLLDSTLSSDQKELAESIQMSAQSLLTVIDDILDFSKIEARRLTIVNQPFNLKELVANLERLLQLRFKSRSLEFLQEVRIADNRLLMGDAARLQQVLINLITNATKFTEAGGSVLLQIRTVEEHDRRARILFSVADTGVGIPAEKQRAIFDAFSQVDSSMTRSQGGTGLGLTISSALVEMMGGGLSVVSTPGVGSNFFFTLEFAQIEPEHLRRVERSNASERQVAALHVLLAEDNLVNQRVAIRFLEKEGHNVVLATNGSEAVEKYKQDEFDLILMDIQMPVMGGEEATKLIRDYESGEGKHVPIIALTAHAIVGDREKFLSSGMDDYVSKPLDRLRLFEAIERVCGVVSTKENS